MSSDGTVIAFGENGNDDNGLNSGRVRVFRYDGSQWGLGISIQGENAGDQFGCLAVSIVQGDGTVRMYTTVCPTGE